MLDRYPWRVFNINHLINDPLGPDFRMTPGRSMHLYLCHLLTQLSILLGIKSCKFSRQLCVVNENLRWLWYNTGCCALQPVHCRQTPLVLSKFCQFWSCSDCLGEKRKNCTKPCLSLLWDQSLSKVCIAVCKQHFTSSRTPYAPYLRPSSLIFVANLLASKWYFC